MPEYRVDLPSGQSYSIKADSDEAAQAAINDLTGENKGGSGLEAFGRAAVNNLPLGGQLGALGTMATDPAQSDYSNALESWNKGAEEAKSAHPTAYGAGAVTGALAPAAIPGIGEMGMAGNIAMGAGYGLGNVDLVKQPTEALKQGLAGAGIGAVTHGIASKLMPEAHGLEEYANRKTVEATHLPAGLLNIPKDELEELGQNIHSLGIDKGTLDDQINTAQTHLKDIGQQIGQMGEDVSPLQNPTPFVDQLHNHLQESASIYGADANPEATIYRQGIANLQQPNLTFDQLQKLKQVYGQRAFDNLGNVKNDAAANVYRVIKDAMKSVIQGSPEEYQSLMTKYSSLLDINTALGKLRGIQNAGGNPAKAFGMLGKMGAMVTGGNVPATVGLAAAVGPAHPFMGLGVLTGIVNNPGAMASAARTTASAIPAATSAIQSGSMDAITSKLFNTLQSNPQSLGKFAQPLMKAAQTGGSQGIAATHFLLSHQYPEYTELMMHGLEHKTIEASNEHIGEEGQ